MSGQPRQVCFLIDARASSSLTLSSSLSSSCIGDGRRRRAAVSAEVGTFVARALERATDALKQVAPTAAGVKFSVRMCDAMLAPHAFDARVREIDSESMETSTSERVFAFGEFYACTSRDLDCAMTRVDDIMVSYGERYSNSTEIVGRVQADGLDDTKSWLVNLTRNIGTVTNDFEQKSFGAGLGAFGDDDASDGDDYSVVFIVAPLPARVPVHGLDAAAVLKSFKGIEDRFKRDKIRAHLLFTGPEPTGMFGDILRDVFRKFQGAVFPLDAAVRIAQWVPLYSALGQFSAARSSNIKEGETHADDSYGDIDIVVETGSNALRLGNVRASRCDGSIAITAFINRSEIPAPSLLVETQTIVSFDDSPVRALAAMLVLKHVAAIIRWDSRGSQHAGILEPLTCASFLITMTRAPHEDANPSPKAQDMFTAFEQLLSQRSSLGSLENIEALLTGVRDDLQDKTYSPPSTQDLALTQLTNDSLGTQPSQVQHAPVELHTLEEAFSSDQTRGVMQAASRLESWYATRDFAVNTRTMLARLHSENTKRESATKSTKEELISALDTKFKSMLKAHNGIVSPPRPVKAKRSLASTLMASTLDESQVSPWQGSPEDIEIAVRSEYDAIVSKFKVGEDDLDPDLSELAGTLIYRFRKSLGAVDETIAMDDLINRLQSAILVPTKKLALAYIKAPSKVAKRREYLLQAHITLQLAGLKVDSARSEARKETPEELEDRILEKKGQKKTMKNVAKLLNEITFVLVPSGLPGIMALMENDLIPKYNGNLPGTLRLLQDELGVSMEKAMPVADSSVALTPFSPVPLRRSPRKPKRPDALTYSRPIKEKQVMVPPKEKPPQSWHHFARGRIMRREVKVTVNPKSFAPPKPKLPGTSRQLIHELPLATPVPRGGNFDRGNARIAATPAVAKRPPLFSNVVAETPVVAGRPGVIAETPLGTQFNPSQPNGLSTPISMSQVVRKFPSLTSMDDGQTPAPPKRTGTKPSPESTAKRSRFSDGK